jgi:HK97 family phage major capsid protein
MEGDNNKEMGQLVLEVRENWNAVKGMLPALQEVKGAQDDFRGQMAEIKRALMQRSGTGVVRPGYVSDGCAKFLAGVAIKAKLQKGGTLSEDVRQKYDSLAREAMGIQGKTALTTSDVPMPTDYAAEVVELVNQYGAARRYGTVYPLGTGVTQLPRLKTSPAFGLLTIAVAVTEKSPQYEFVTFTVSKWGGMVRLPSELDADSIVALGQFIARYAAREMAKIEDVVFWTGDGTGTYASLSGLTKAVDTLTKLVTLGSTKTHYSDVTLANLRALRAVPSSAVLGRAAYYMHSTFEQHLAGLNTAGDKPYVANGIQGASLDGFPIRWVDALPVYSTSANASKVPILFGDPSYMYLGVRGGMMFDTSVEAAFATDEILIRAMERFTIGYMADEAVAGIKTAAS